MEKTVAMILAGGKGKRMDALCHARPKPLLPFAGSYRVIDYTLSNCAGSGIRRVAVLLDYQRAQMAKYLINWQAGTGGLPGLDILEPDSGSFRGTADAVYQQIDYLLRSDADLVLVLAGDHIYTMDYREMVSFHREMHADASIGVVAVPAEQTYRFGTVILDSDSRVTSFVEKSFNSLGNLASMGIYVFNKRFLIERLVEDATRLYSTHDFGFAIIPDIVKRDRVFAFPFRDYWQDIGNCEAYFTANMDMLKSSVIDRRGSGGKILTECDDTALAGIMNQGNVRNSLVCPGCIVNGTVENSILSHGVKVEEKAVVRNSIVMAGVRVGYRSFIDHCIVDEGVSISPFSSLGNGFDVVPVTTLNDFHDQGILTGNII